MEKEKDRQNTGAMAGIFLPYFYDVDGVVAAYAGGDNFIKLASTPGSIFFGHILISWASFVSPFYISLSQ